MMTAAQQVAHAAQTIDWFIQGAFRPEGFDVDFEKAAKEVNAYTSLAKARQWFERAMASAKATDWIEERRRAAREIARGRDHGRRAADGDFQRHHRSHRTSSGRVDRLRPCPGHRPADALHGRVAPADLRPSAAAG